MSRDIGFLCPETPHSRGHHLRGWECATCSAWRAGQPDDYLLDMVATIVRDERFDALGNPNRTRFHVVPHLAAQMGIKAWIDIDDTPVGSPWLHLSGIREAYQAECDLREIERAAVLARRDTSPEADAAARARWRIGRPVESEVEWARMAEDQRLGVKRTISDAEADRMIARERKLVEKAGRR